ncbi:MAG: hypothetical protein PHI98_10800 [Eubacteriales bacterium]|nr:hypothetical protein [Eubacteriales bacterium]
MKKNVISLFLILCLLFGTAAAETASPAELEIEVSYDGVEVEVASAAIGFLIPSDFAVAELTQEQQSQGLLLAAESVNPSYRLDVTLTQSDYEAMLQALQATEGVSDIQDYLINGVNYLTYSVQSTSSQVGIVFLGENCDEALAFSFAIPSDVNAGTIPLEIMGSLYEL